MNQKTILLAVGVFALFLIANRKPKAAKAHSEWAEEIFYGDPNGWKYYTDGTAIDPDGNYYKNGALIYRAQ